MLKFFKPARDKNVHQRGYFSYITEGLIHIHNLYLTYPDETFKIYFDLEEIQGYGKQNIYDICFAQDNQDWLINKSEYVNIESIPLKTTLNHYDNSTFTKDDLMLTEMIISRHFILNDEMSTLTKNRYAQINFDTTIGFHRRATDMESIHHFRTIQLSEIFNILEQEEFENIFLMSDNISDKKQFEMRYGNRLITFDDFTSSDETLPFFKQIHDEMSVKRHIQEIVFGALALGQTKKLFCTNSNLSTFSILSNSQLNYLRLN